MGEGEPLIITNAELLAKLLRSAQDPGGHGIALFVGAGSRQCQAFRRFRVLLDLDSERLTRPCAGNNDTTIWPNGHVNGLHVEHPPLL